MSSPDAMDDAELLAAVRASLEPDRLDAVRQLNSACRALFSCRTLDSELLVLTSLAATGHRAASVPDTLYP